MFPFVRVGARRGAQDSNKIMQRLEGLVAGQTDIKQWITLLMKSETELVKAQEVQLQRLRPPSAAWIQAAVLLVISGAAIIAGGDY
jgi:hypothetical protein